MLTDKNTLAKNSNESEADKADGTLQNANEKIESIAGPSNHASIIEDINEYELMDSDEDINVPIHDDFSFISNDINKNAFDSDKESEIDINESLASLDKKHLSKTKSNPALAYLLEYSGLSQNQIMHLMKYNKNKNHKTKTVSKNAKMHEKKTNSELTKGKTPAIAKSILTFPENCMEISKSVKSQNMLNACSTNDNMIVKLISSNVKADDFTKEESLKNNAEALDVPTSNVISTVNKSLMSEECSSIKSNNNTRVELISTVQTDTSDSDSDDFVEIQDVPIPYMGRLEKNIIENVEIAFKTNEKLEDDIFADIFKKADKNESKNEDLLTSCSKQIQSVNENGKHRMPLISEDNNLKINLLDTTPEELIIEKTEIKSLENTQLVENISNDEGKVHSHDFNNLIKKNNIELSTQNNCNEDMQEKIAVLPTNKEDLIKLKVYFQYYFCK